MVELTYHGESRQHRMTNGVVGMRYFTPARLRAGVKLFISLQLVFSHKLWSGKLEQEVSYFYPFIFYLLCGCSWEGGGA